MSRAPVALAIVLIAALTAGCGSSPTAPPTSGRPSAGPTPTTQPAPFDPAIALRLEPFAHVPGGPLAITGPRDDSGRLFVAAQDGRAWVVAADGSVGRIPLIDLRVIVTNGGERGLLGIAVHPGFPTDPRVFVDYTDRDGNTVVAAYLVDPNDPNRLVSASALVLLQVRQPYANHNGGALAFGPDGYLYVSLGDGGSGGDPQGNGQRLDTLLGKILRIDVDQPTGERPYGTPPDNPFADLSGARPEIWLYGLRNPWRMSFDRATGDLWIGDVGQGTREEVDVAPAGVGGLNFGWNRMEGSRCYQPALGCSRVGLTMPLTDYGHAGGNCVVIGGTVYRGAMWPQLVGGYVYSDFCSGTIWALAAAAADATPVVVGSGAGRIAAFGEDEAGELYAADLDGTISRVVADAR